jgi:glycosyltransferase involved in cell wall biosynthesis
MGTGIKKACLASNMLNEVEQIPRWLESFKPVADGGMLVVDGGSTDGTIELLEKNGVTVVVDNIIQREGYGPARNHLREMARKHFPEAEWLAYFDADETIDESDRHQFRFLKDYLIEDFDVIAFPRIDWMNTERTKAAKDWRANPDYQARMSRLGSEVVYQRRLHELVANFRQIYADLSNPKINHFHRSADQKKRDFVGKLCAMLHQKDEMGSSYPEHPKEAYYRELLEKEGL